MPIFFLIHKLALEYSTSLVNFNRVTVMFPKVPSSGCHNKLPYTGWLKRQTLISHISGDSEVQIEGAGRLFLVRTRAVRSRPMAVFLHLHMMGRGEGRKLPSAFACVRSQLFGTLDGSPPGSSACGILQPRILEWVAVSFSRGSSRPRDWTCVSCVPCIGTWILRHWATWEVLMNLGEAQTRSPQDDVNCAWRVTVFSPVSASHTSTEFISWCVDTEEPRLVWT